MNICYVGGAGRLGFPIAYHTASRGNNVIIADKNSDAVKSILANGRTDTYEPISITRTFSGSISATTDTQSAVRSSDMIFVIVPTPSLRDGSFSLKYILAACNDIGAGIADTSGKIIVIVSTINPGDIRSYIEPTIRMASSNAEFDIVYSPEFVAQGSVVRDFANPDVILLGGDCVPCARVIKHYFSVIDNTPSVRVMSIESSEITKIGLNASVVTKLAVANQIAWLCHMTDGASADDVLSAISSDTRISDRYFSAGPPDGGPCFPRDVYALGNALDRAGVSTILADSINAFRHAQVDMIAVEVLMLMHKLSCETVCVLGRTYKPGVDIVECSPGQRIYDLLRNTFGDVVTSYDPALDEDLKLGDAIENSDMLVIMTKWDEFTQLRELQIKNKVVFDMWHMFDGLPCRKYIAFGG